MSRILSPGHPVGAVLIVGVVFSSVYWGAAALSWAAPTVLTPSRVDSKVPLLQWSIWVYLSACFLVLFSLLLVDRTTRSITVVAMTVACLLCGTAYLLFPTTIVRLETLPQGISGIAWKLLYALDTPKNALPSLHAAFAIVAGVAFWSLGALWRAIGLVWVVGILMSALTVKQHFVADVLAGCLAGGVAQILGHLVIVGLPERVRDAGPKQ